VREHEKNAHDDSVPETSTIDPAVFTRASDDLISCSICMGLFRDEKDLMKHQNQYHAKNNGQIILHAPVSESKRVFYAIFDQIKIYFVAIIRIIARTSTPNIYRYVPEQSTPDNNCLYRQQAVSFR
jgi:uncharacterized C2H2 Zn-finger protein